MKNTLIHTILVSSAALLACVSSAFAEGNDNIAVNKYISEYNYETGRGVLTLEQFLAGAEGILSTAQDLDAVLVLDFSSSMTDPYTVDSTFKKVVYSQKYGTGFIYYNNNGSYSGISSLSSDVVDKQAYVSGSGSSKTALKIPYNGTQYDVYFSAYKDPNASTSYGAATTSVRTWAYIKVNNKRVFLRMDGSFMEENATTTTISYTNWPKGTDGFYITPTKNTDYILYATITESGTVSHTTTRSEALMFAAGRFVELLSQHASDYGKTDRIAIVSFQQSGTNEYPVLLGGSAGDYYTSTSKTYLMECPTDVNASGNENSDFAGKSVVLKRFVDMSTPNAVNILKFAISNTTPKGTTPHNNGMTLAKELMANYGRTGDVARYIIVFSDGEPVPQGGGSGFNSGGIADQAVATAYTLKHHSTRSSSIFTIYCHSENPSTSANTFMDHLSSNYPNAQTYNDNTTKLSGTEAKYYKVVKDGLATVFDEIGKELTTVTVNSKYDANTKLTDVINTNAFQLKSGTTSSNILVYKDKCTGYNSTNQTYSWANNPTQITSGLTINVSNSNKVEVSGFDFASNWCGKKANSTAVNGYKLIIKIPFEYNGAAVAGAIATNTSASRVYVKSGSTYTEDQAYNVPTLDLYAVQINRSGLQAGESATYTISNNNASGSKKTYSGKVIVSGTGSGTASRWIYGLPNGTYTATETNWNWDYNKGTNPQSITTPTDYKYIFNFTGAHKSESENSAAKTTLHDESHADNKLQ